jgi:hypothetical protein
MLDPGENHAQSGLAALLVDDEFSRTTRNWSIYLSTADADRPVLRGFANSGNASRRGATTSHMAFDMP